MTGRNARFGAVLAGLLLVSACGNENSNSATTTTNPAPQSSAQATTTIQPGRVEDLVRVLWQVDEGGNAVSVLPESGDVGAAWQNATDDGSTFTADVVADDVTDSSDAFGQSAVANGGGAWKRVYEISRTIAGQSSADQGVVEGYLSISVAVVRRGADTAAVRRASEAGVPPGSSRVEVGGAPVGSYAYLWSSSNTFGEHAYLDSVNNSVIVRCEVQSLKRDSVSVCAAANAYILERLGDSYID
jgi:hypothetical protein